MKKGFSFALILAVLLSAFACCFTTVSAEVAKEFVIDGNMDVWYLTNEETPEDDINYYHIVSMDAYNLDPHNGHGIYFYDGAETAAEMYTAFDDTYIYVYVKCWDDDIAINPNDKNGSSISDSIEIWFDSDPNSQTHNPDGSEKEDPKGWPDNTQDPEQGDIRLRLRAADFKVSDVPGVVKPNYNGVKASEYFTDRANLMPFYFENEPMEVASGDIVSSGYGVEVRFPRYDATGGNAYRVNVACNNRLEGSLDDGAVEEWSALATGQAWWLDYSYANQVIYPKSGNPFFDQDITGQTLYYTENDTTAEGVAVKEAIAGLPSTVTVLEKNQVMGIIDAYNALSDYNKDYVKARNFDVLKAAADKLGLALEGDVTPEPGPDPEPDPEPTVTLGDVNGDTKIDAKDALLVLRIAVNKYQANEEEMIAADCNKDEKTDAKDALEILKYAVGKPSCLA